MRYVSAGESHGPALCAIVSDVPAGIVLSQEAIDRDLARRQSGYGRGGRQRIEHDKVEVTAGVRFGRTLGSPVCLQVRNDDFSSWAGRMDVFGTASEGLQREVTPRPGHADLVGALKTGTRDCRDILERASARETAARVAAGSVARAFLAQLGVQVLSYVTRIGSASFNPDQEAYPTDDIEESPVRCPNAAATGAMCAAIDEAKAEGDSLGGAFRVVATGLVVGLGGYASADQRLTSRLGGALFSIPAIKDVSFGMGARVAGLPGSQVHDEIEHDAEGFRRGSNNAGGLEGGMTTGEPLVVSACMKPIPTLTKPLRTVNLDDLSIARASRERSDTCAVPAAAVVAEAEVCLVLADAYTRKFGCDSVQDVLASMAAYKSGITQ